MSSAGNLNAGNQKPICTICFEDLKPITEDLQSIPICGHVFHELCIQQWVEYCPPGKKPTCPVCKQGCTRSLTRLYFQSTGEQTQSCNSPSRRYDPEEVARLEGKLSAITAKFENQQEYIDKINQELSLWKELSKEEEAKKEAIKKEKECTELFLKIKMEELSRTSTECTKLQERSLALAKELASLKLATDLNLGEEDMVKLASLGHENNTKNAIDVLKKSLAIRNKCYKELMAQCNTLGRSDARTRKKLDKAKEKIRKLNMRLQEFEKTLEEKESELERNLKSSYKGQIGKNLELPAKSKQTEFSNDHHDRLKRTFNYPKVQNESTSLSYKANNNVIDIETDPCFLDENDFKLPSEINEPESSYIGIDIWPMDDEMDVDFTNTRVSSTHQHTSQAGQSSSLCTNMTSFQKGIPERVVASKITQLPSLTCATETLLIDDISKQKPSIAVKKDVQAFSSAACSGDQSIPGGHFGHEGANRGKWCRTSSLKIQASKNDGDLISVGADGRGGRVKVLRDHSQVLDGKAKSLCPKKLKHGTKQSGQFHIEHFFGKT